MSRRAAVVSLYAREQRPASRAAESDKEVVVNSLTGGRESLYGSISMLSRCGRRAPRGAWGPGPERRRDAREGTPSDDSIRQARRLVLIGYTAKNKKHS